MWVIEIRKYILLISLPLELRKGIGMICIFAIFLIANAYGANFNF